MLDHLQLTRPLAILDCETTGVSPENDQIVELAIIVRDPDGTVTDHSRRIRPTVSIPAAATLVHGITDADVADCPTFKQVSKAVAALLEPCDIAGFGITRFDIPCLDAHFERARISFDWNGRSILDALQIFHEREPRNLEAAAKRYTGKAHVDAHGAVADARAVAAVVDGMLEHYIDLPSNVEALAALFDDPGRVDWGRKLRREDGEIVVRFGKHKGRTLTDLAANERGYLQWLLNKTDFRAEVKDHVRAALAGASAAKASTPVQEAFDVRELYMGSEAPA